MVREIDASRPGQPMAVGQPGLGCTCHVCILGTFNLSDDARIVAEDLVSDLARLNPAIRRNAAAACVVSWLAEGVRLPPAHILAGLANRVEGARRSLPRLNSNTLPVEAARAVPILAVVRRLGLDLKHIGTSWRGPCPIHGGEHRNFSIDPVRGLWHCFSCGAGGDTIDLLARVRGLGFVDAVRELVR